VILVSLPNDTSSIVTKMIGRNFNPKVLGIAPSWLSGFAANPDFGQFMQQNYVWLGFGPAWGDQSVPGMAKMIADQQQHAPGQEPDTYFAFGYAQAWAMDQILERAVRNGDLSKAGITRASNQVGTLKFDGLIGDYRYGKSAGSRNPPRVTTVATPAPGQPTGLQVVEGDYSSRAARQISFKEG
jgi:Periplasmic binding protein